MADCFAMWGVCRRPNPEGRTIAIFRTTEECYEWLQHMKEECFFRTGSMETAEKDWGFEHFNLERIAVYSTMDTMASFHNRLNMWTQ